MQRNIMQINQDTSSNIQICLPTYKELQGQTLSCVGYLILQFIDKLVIQIKITISEVNVCLLKIMIHCYSIEEPLNCLL